MTTNLLRLEAKVLRHRELMLEHSLLIPLKPGEKPEMRPCGWPNNKRRESDHG